jgi:hypothetical protein
MSITCDIIHDDINSGDDGLNSAYAYFLYIHLLYFDVVVDIANEMTLYFPRIKTKISFIYIE